MKHFLPIVSAALILASCSTAYQTGQTPDDVYFSPERQRDEYARVEKKENRRYIQQSEEELREERYLRMRTNDRRYLLLDDYDYYTYSGNNYYRYNSYNNYFRHNNFGYYNNPVYWNSWDWNYNSYYYNPYYNKPYYSGYVAGHVRPIYTKPRAGNLNTYGNGNNANTNTPRNNGRSFGSSRDDNYRGSGTNAGGFMRDVFSGSSNSKTTSPSSSTPSSSGSSSSGSSSKGSSSAPVRKF